MEDRKDRKLAKLNKKIQILEKMIEDKTRNLFAMNSRLESSLLFNRQVFSNLKDAVIVLDVNDNVFYSNTKADSELSPVNGEKLGEVLAQSVGEVVGGEDKEITFKDRCYVMSITTFEFDDVEKKILSFRNVTARKALEAEVEEQKAHILFQSKLASVGEMASSVAHEINNPMAIIDGQMRRLAFFTEEEPNVEKQNELIVKVQSNIKRVSSIIKGLRRISKMGEHEELKTIPLYDFFNDFEEFSYVKFVDNSIDVTYPEVLSGFYIKGKDTSITQIITNLLNNSIDALEDSGSAEKPWVKILIEENQDNINIRIVDSGSGIPYEVVKEIFNPFFTTKSALKGTGIGLSICKKLARDIDGDLYYEEFNGNTSFVLSLKNASAGLERVG